MDAAEGTTTTADHLAGVLPHHLAHLRASGLTDATILAAHIVRETSPQKLATLLGWSKPSKNLAPAIVFPYFDRDGHNDYSRVRPDTPRKIKGKPVKYESPRGQPNRIYVPPAVATVLDNPAAELLLTEGEKKSLAATQAGLPCIGLGGVWGWKEKRHERLLPELDRVKWRRRQVWIVFDSDLERKPNVQLAEARLAKQLTDRGAKVRCVRLPDDPADATGKPTKMGLDDFLVAYDAVALRKLLDSAIEPEPLEGAEGKEHAAALNPGDEAKKYIDTWKQDGLPRLRFYHGDWLLHRDGCYHQHDQTDVRANLVRHLDHSYHHLGIGHTSNVLDHVKAQAILSADKEPPCWLGEAVKLWKPDEILAAKNGLIHLPTLIAGGRDYLIPPTPRFFCQSATDFDFDVAAPKPELWLSLMAQYWPDDPAAVGTLQEWFGLCLVADTSFQKILLLIGPTAAAKARSPACRNHSLANKTSPGRH
jgi:hypothetical protein